MHYGSKVIFLIDHPNPWANIVFLVHLFFNKLLQFPINKILHEIQVK